METMRFRETKKASYKLQIFCITLFLLIGIGIIYFAICSEKEPTLIGSTESDIYTKSNLDESDALENVDQPVENASDLYSITNKSISDKTVKQIKANITLPVISIKGESLTNLNDEILGKFNDTYNSFKSTMANANNNFTYTVTYKSYSNIVEKNNVLSITIYERMIDDSAKTNSMEKIYAYNINLKDGTVLKQNDVVIDILGAEYKDDIKAALKNYVVTKCGVKEADYNYSYTGLETFYVKDSKFHLVFNPDELAAKKYGILDITIN